MPHSGNIVLDTNFVSRGRYQSERLRSVVGKLSSRGHVVIVPEVVIWEWSNHLHRTMELASRGIERARNEIVSAGLGLQAPRWALPDSLELAELVEADVRGIEGVEIRRCSETQASAAIRSQVLQIGTGTVKHGIKTGAADAMVLSAFQFEMETGSSLEPTILCTNDRRLIDQALLLPDAEVLQTFRDLWRWHGMTTPTDDELLGALTRWMDSASQDWRAGDTTALPFDRFDMATSSVRALRSATDLPHGVEPYMLDARLRFIDNFSVVQPAVTEDAIVPHVVTAVIQLEGVVTLEEWSLSEEGSLEYLCDDLRVAAHIPVVAGFDTSWRIESVDVVDPPLVRAIEGFEDDMQGSTRSIGRAS